MKPLTDSRAAPYVASAIGVTVRADGGDLDGSHRLNPSMS